MCAIGRRSFLRHTAGSPGTSSRFNCSHCCWKQMGSATTPPSQRPTRIGSRCTTTGFRHAIASYPLCRAVLYRAVPLCAVAAEPLPLVAATACSIPLLRGADEGRVVRSGCVMPSSILCACAYVSLAEHLCRRALVVLQHVYCVATCCAVLHHGELWCNMLSCVPTMPTLLQRVALLSLQNTFVAEPWWEHGSSWFDIDVKGKVVCATQCARSRVSEMWLITRC